ncbi:MAG: hypothetical protein ACT4PE_09715 [Candidatus Eiseniibacteriota bacterium]
MWLVAVPPLAVCLIGLPYYVAPLSERLWSPYHDWLKPSGYVGQSAGFLALGMFLFLWLYPLRKKFAFLAFTGGLARWLDVHVIVGLVLPLVAAIHSAWRFNGLIGLGYGAMMVVCLSGVVGRYLYVRIPRQRSGLELGREEAAAVRRKLVGDLVSTTGLPPEHVEDLLRPVPAPRADQSAFVTLARMVRDDLGRRRAVSRLLREWKQRGAGGKAPDRDALRRVTRLARREMALSQQIRLLDATNRVFRLWHVFHRPFAVTALLAVLVHVVVVIALGATWIH